jgi:hypothetical protein
MSKIIKFAFLSALLFVGGVVYAQSDTTLFSRNMTLGVTDKNVKNLQILLNADTETRLSGYGYGSAAKETDFFGYLTYNAVIRFQEKFADDILRPLGLLKGTGFVGPLTMEKLNSLASSLDFSINFSNKLVAGASVHNYDVVVVGAGTGGVGAAIQATRMGSNVALVEETDWIGGQMTAAAVTSIDGGNEPGSGTGLYAEFRELVQGYYENEERFPPSGKSISTCYFSDQTMCFEPKVGRDILTSMLQEAGVDIFLREKVTTVLKNSNTVTGVVTDKGNIFNAEVVVDATEYGDVIPLAGARYRVGNSISGNISTNSCIQDVTYTAVLKKYYNGLPPGFLLQTPPLGYESAKAVFETFVTKEGLNKWSRKYPVSWPLHVAYRGMPDSSNSLDYTGKDISDISKTGLNWANDYPGHRIVTGADGKGVADWLGQLSVNYIESPSERRRLNCEAKLKTLQFVYYVQNELGEKRWSISNEEGFDTSYNIEENLCDTVPAEYKVLERHFPVIPYVRESRRIVGLDTLTGAEMKRQGSPPRAVTNFKTSLAVGDYPNDLHNCSTNDLLEADLGETGVDISGRGLFQIPFESFIPESVDGLIAAEKNISVSRLTNGATRLQPVTMATGQAAGAIAHFAAKNNIQPRFVEPLHIQESLLESGNALSLYHFSDVSQEDSFWKDVQMSSLYGVLAGYPDGRFGAGDPLTREQMAVVLVTLFDIPLDPVPSTATFSDVGVNKWSYRFVEAIVREGLTAGCGTNPLRFCPTDPVTKSQTAVFLVRGLGLDTAAFANDTPLFIDVSTSRPFFQFVQAAVKNNIMEGCNSNMFCPGDNVLREEIAGHISAVLRKVK